MTPPSGSALTVPDVSADRAGEPGPDVAEARGSTRPMFTITDAATACSVSRKTITRKLPELAVHGAAKDDDGVWRIPVEALLAVGLHPGRSLPQSCPLLPGRFRPCRPRVVLRIRTPSPSPRDRWDDVRIRLARAEAEASERGLAAGRCPPGPPGPDRGAGRGLTRLSGVDRPGDGCAARPTRGIAGSGTAGATPTQGQAAPAGVAAGVASSGQASDQGVDSSHGPTSPVATSPEMSVPAPGDGLDALPADVVAARNLAARTGGYVPSGATPARKRRWWQSR